MKSFEWTTSDIIKAACGELLSGSLNEKFLNISTDSRNISDKDLFAAIKGSNFDGHKFISDVVKSGVKGIIFTPNFIDENTLNFCKNKQISCVAVFDTIKALGDLARFQRNALNPKIIAITGTNGKTSTKEMTYSIVSRSFNTHHTKGNFNNEIGLPKTLFQLNYSHELAVLELGMNSFGEIRKLADICSPDIGVITNIGHAHLKGLRSIEGVMQAKGELIEKIKHNGTAILNADNPYCLKLAKKCSNNLILFGFSKDVHIKAVDIEEKGKSVFFNLVLPSSNISVELKTLGRFMISNALAAASVGYLLGISPEEIKKGIENFNAVKGRLNIVENSYNINLIDDTYNANPDSMEAAITTLSLLKGDNRAILVAGDMFELGDYSEFLHKKIGKIAANKNIDRIYATGAFAKNIYEGAIEEGMNSKSIFIGGKEEIVKDMKKCLRSNDFVLIKGSRAMAMEKIVEALKI